MIDLNILSQERQAAIKGRMTHALVERIMVSLVVAVLMGTLLLLFMKIRLSDTLATIQSRQVLGSQYVSVNKRIEELNGSVKTIERFQKEAVPASIMLTDIASRTPEGVLISQLTFETPTESVRIVGFAETRDQLLAYEGALLESPYLTELDSPISNLFERTDLNFTFNAVMDVERLKAELDPAGPDLTEDL